jgi:acetamidase/formamidase
MGIDLDLNVAMREAIREAVEFLQKRFGLTPADAYALTSIAVDFRVAEAVDSTQVIYGTIPKKLFKQSQPYWTSQ